MKIWVKSLIFAMSLLANAMEVRIANAQSFPYYQSGRIIRFYADQVDIVIQLDQNGPCGGSLFVISRGSTNFQEMSALMLTAAASRNEVILTISSCNSDRNMVTHGSSIF